MHSTSGDFGPHKTNRNSSTSKQSILDNKQARRLEVKISQTTSNGPSRKGPNTILRSLASNDSIGIQRKIGEGSLPLFEREDVRPNEVPINEVKDEDKKRVLPSTSHSSYKQDAQKSKKYVHRGCCGKSPPPKLTTTTKVPYFRDEIREKDRLKRLYGDYRLRKSRSSSPARTGSDRSRNRRRSTSRDRHRRYSSYKRSRSSSSEHRSRRSRRYYSPNLKRRSNSHNSQRTRRSRSLSIPRKKLRHRNSSLHYRERSSPNSSHKSYTRDTRKSRSGSVSSDYGSRSKDRDKNRHVTKTRENQTHNQSDITQTFIPIPVPVPTDFSYSFPHWPIPTHHPWTPQRGMSPFMQPFRPMYANRFPDTNFYMQYAPFQAYRSCPVQRFHNPKPNFANNQNRHKYQEGHK